MADDVIERDEGESEEDSRTDGGSSGGVVSELKNVAADAALAVLAPVAKKAATSAAKYAVSKGPELVEDTVMPALEDAGGVKGLVAQLMPEGGASGMLSKLTPGGGDDDGGSGDAGDATGKGRRMPVQQAVDVAAPLEVVYDQWTQLEDFPKFMHRVNRVEQRDESHVAFHAKVWGINRMWEAEIVEQRPDERIVFKSVNGVQLTGVVTFHELAERLTRVEVNLDLEPDGPIEKFARGARFVKRATRGDLKRFKAFVEMHEDETGAWRGEIQEGDVVSESDEGEDEGYEDEEPEASYEDEYEDEEDGEPAEEDADEEEYELDPEAEGDVEEQDEEEDDEEEEAEKPRPRSRATSRSSGGSGSGSSSSGRSRARGSNGRGGGSSSKRKRGSANGGDPKRTRQASKSRGSSSGGAKGSKSGSSGRSRSSSGGGSSSSRRSSSSGSRSRSSRAKSSSRSKS